MEAPITRTCKPVAFALAATLLSASPAAASSGEERLHAYVKARAADADGSVTAAAAGYATALADGPGNEIVAIRAYREALAAGDMMLVRRAAAILERSNVAPADSALLRVADRLAAGDGAGAKAALAALKRSPLDFLIPSIEAWIDFDGDHAAAIAQLSGDHATPLGRRYAAENQALMLIAGNRRSDGLIALKTLIGSDRGSLDLRINAAQLLIGAGDADDARSLLGGDDPVLAALRARPGKGKSADARFGVSRLFTRLGGELTSDGTQPLAIVLARSALILDPSDDRSRLLLADALSREKAYALAGAALGEIDDRSIFSRAARGAEIVVLQRAGEDAKALAVAASLAKDGTGSELRVYGDLLASADRFEEAADAYGLASDRGGGGEPWLLALQQGGALERAGHWDRALPLLKRAVALSPDEPLALNYLGYAQIERGENVGDAQKLIERASALQPDDPSITDSLGWAYFLRGKTDQAVPLLERAARGEPANSTIQEHLGDAYWTSGRFYEARYAWRAAVLHADTGEAARITAKIGGGLTSARN